MTGVYLPISWTGAVKSIVLLIGMLSTVPSGIVLLFDILLDLQSACLTAVD